MVKMALFKLMLIWSFPQLYHLLQCTPYLIIIKNEVYGYERDWAHSSS